MSPTEPDLANLPRFIAHLGDRDAALAGFVQRLLDTGWLPISFRGPEQMDVWSLTLRRGQRCLGFGIERGMVDGVTLWRADEEPPVVRSLHHAYLGWARARGVHVTLDDPDRFRPELGADAIKVLQWLDDGNDGTLARIGAAWEAYFKERNGPGQRRDEDWLARTKASGIRDIEAAAAAPRAEPG